MKLYLASFLEPQNFGNGRIISVARGDKPKNIVVDNIYLPFTPPAEILTAYNEAVSNATPQEITEVRKEAGAQFQKSYQAHLESFVTKVLEASIEEGKTPQELLPFKDGDTLCSWERNHNTHYRKTLASFISKLGYEVVQH